MPLPVLLTLTKMLKHERSQGMRLGVPRLSAAAAAAALAAVAVVSCGGQPQAATPLPTEAAVPTSVVFEPSPPPPVSPPRVPSTRPVVPSPPVFSGPGRGESPVQTVPSAATTAPSRVETSTTLPSGSSTTLPALSGVGVSAWSTEKLAGFFEARVQSFEHLDGPKYDVSTPLGAFCWARWEVVRANAFEAILSGRPPYDEPPFDVGEGEDVTAFKVLREELVNRARRGDVEAVRVLQDAASVRIPGEDHSVASAVEAITPEVRTRALSAGDAELRSVAEALFIWVDEHKRNPGSEATALDGDLFLPVRSTRFCEHPPPPELADTFTIEEMRALTLEEVENLTLEQLRDIDIETVTNEGLLLRDFPLDLRFAWSEKSSVQSTEYYRDRCCYSLTAEGLVESLAMVLEVSPFAGNENDPSTPLGAYCWSIWEVYRSHFLRSSRYFKATMFDLFVAELHVRVEMGVAEAADALRGVPAELPLREYPFADALEAVDDPRMRVTAFGAEDPVLLEAVGVFYDLVDEYRREEFPSPNAFMGEFLPNIMPELAPGASSQPESDNQALEVFLKECKPSGEFA